MLFYNKKTCKNNNFNNKQVKTNKNISYDRQIEALLESEPLLKKSLLFKSTREDIANIKRNEDNKKTAKVIKLKEKHEISKKIRKFEEDSSLSGAKRYKLNNNNNNNNNNKLNSFEYYTNQKSNDYYDSYMDSGSIYDSESDSNFEDEDEDVFNSKFDTFVYNNNNIAGNCFNARNSKHYKVNYLVFCSDKFKKYILSNDELLIFQTLLDTIKNKTPVLFNYLYYKLPDVKVCYDNYVKKIQNSFLNSNNIFNNNNEYNINNNINNIDIEDDSIRINSINSENSFKKIEINNNIEVRKILKIKRQKF